MPAPVAVRFGSTRGPTPGDAAPSTVEFVTIGLLDGRAFTGRVQSFSPLDTRLTVHIAGAGEQRATERRVAAAHLAYVVFHRKASPPRSVPVALEAPIKLRVSVAGEKAFVVWASATAIEKPPGFFGVPVEKTESYDRIFFYSQGVTAKEDPELLGALLVRDGQIGEAQLSRALDVQRGASPAGPPPGAPHLPAALASSPARGRTGEFMVADFLVAEGLLSKAEVDSALSVQPSVNKRLGDVLLDMGLIGEDALYRTLAKKFHLRFVDLDKMPMDLQAQKAIDENILRTCNVIPVAIEAGNLVVAISDPLATEVYDVLRFHAGSHVTLALAAPTQIKRHLEKLGTAVAESEEPVVSEILEQLEEEEQEESAEEADAEISETDSAVVRLANQVILDACQLEASDIHVEPTEKAVVVRFRVDGDCQPYREFPASLRRKLVARFKIMGGLDISERRRPQDGKIRIRRDGRQIELRIATLPTVNDNEDVVLRIFPSAEPLPLEEMGMTARNLKELREIISKPYGLILCVGPTGSGKTTTLHSVMRQLNAPDMKIWTCEDPVEITQRGLRQVQVSAKIGLTFADALRSFLRADPDVIMVGEIRDFETAAMAVQASLTGHLVCSTLHTNSAVETVTRLLDMGLERFTFADALLGVLAQRLVRRLCPQCRQPRQASVEEHAAVASLYGKDALAAQLGVKDSTDLRLWHAVGCEKCGGRGYSGRIALHELLIVSDKIRELIMAQASVAEIRDRAVPEGMTTLLQDGVQKVVEGKTDIKQVVSVCNR